MSSFFPRCVLLGLVLPLTGFALSTLSGCAKPGNPALYPELVREMSAQPSKVLDVPCVVQSLETCGPTAMTEYLMCLGVTASLSGTKVGHDNVADMMRGWDGATDLDMERVASRFGCQVIYYGLTGDLEVDLRLLRSLVWNGQPVVVGIRHNTWTWFWYRYHYMLAVGYTKDYVLFHNGEKPYMPLGNEEFYRMWTGNGSFFTVERKR
jgi:hypothetical protein